MMDKWLLNYLKMKNKAKDEKFLFECEAEIKTRRANCVSDKTCAGCVRCNPVEFPEARDNGHPTGWHCSCKHYDAGILPSDPACSIYWDREQHEREEREREEAEERERLKRWKKNSTNPPVKLPIVFNGFGHIPECPVCHEMPYSTEQCHWCGQKFIQDEEIEEYSKPITKEGKCFICGAPVTIQISRYNGHKSFRCDKCGCSMIE